MVAADEESAVVVKVERIRRGRRLPEVDYIDAQAARRPPKPTEEGEPDRSRPRAGPKAGPSKLRLPWKINREPK